MRTASLLILVCCVLFACAAPTALRSSSVDGAMPSLAQPESGDELVGIAISGGGSRAATFASYVLEELARIDVGRDAPASMLERVQYISSVSGGSLSAAYYSMTKPDKSEPVLGSDGSCTVSTAPAGERRSRISPPHSRPSGSANAGRSHARCSRILEVCSSSC